MPRKLFVVVDFPNFPYSLGVVHVGNSMADAILTLNEEAVMQPIKQILG